MPQVQAEARFAPLMEALMTLASMTAGKTKTLDTGTGYSVCDSDGRPPSSWCCSKCDLRTLGGTQVKKKRLS